MLKSIISILMLCISSLSMAQLKIPAISPSVEISQKIGLSTISLSYSRPSLRGRSLFGNDGILRYDEIWRTGANAATKIVLSSDVLINDQFIAAGSYALLSTPHKDTWSIHFYPYSSSVYTSYVEQQPLLTVEAKTHQTDYSIESLSIHLEELDIDRAQLVLQWSKSKTSISLRLSQHETIMRGIDRALEGPSSFDYFQAALYLHESQTDLPLALNYIQRATADESVLFFMVYREALIQRDLGNHAEAIKAAKRSAQLSEEAGNKDLARLSRKMITELSE